MRSRGSSVLQRWATGWMIGAHPASYSKDTGGYFPGAKAAGA